MPIFKSSIKILTLGMESKPGRCYNSLIVTLLKPRCMFLNREECFGGNWEKFEKEINRENLQVEYSKK